MKRALILASALALGLTATTYAANPFSDVPAGHWAYDSIEKLAAAGVIDGYGDGTFGGDKLMTRYEMAQIVARAMANGANVDKLAAEFADELDALGVRVANLEKKADAVKIAGEIRAHYANIGGDLNESWSKLRTRIWFKGQVNDNWTYVGMIQNEQNFRTDTGDEKTDFQRAYLEGRLGGVDVQAGRIDTTDITGGNIYDTRFDGLKLTYGKEIKLIGRIGKATDAFEHDIPLEGGDTYSVEAVAKIGKLGDIHGGWWKFKDLTWFADIDDGATLFPSNNIWTAGLNLNVAEDLELTADYLSSNQHISSGNNELDNDGYVIGLNYKGASANRVGSYGLHAKYYHLGAPVVIAHTMNGAHEVFGYDQNDDLIGVTAGFKGYSLMGYYTVAKNMVAGVEWYDLKSLEGADIRMKTLWTQLVLTF